MGCLFFVKTFGCRIVFFFVFLGAELVIYSKTPLKFATCVLIQGRLSMLKLRKWDVSKLRKLNLARKTWSFWSHLCCCFLDKLQGSFGSLLLERKMELQKEVRKHFLACISLTNTSSEKMTFGRHILFVFRKIRPNLLVFLNRSGFCCERD